MNTTTITPTSLEDFVFLNKKAESNLRAIVTGAKPIPSHAKCGIILYGEVGAGKTTLAKRIPFLIEQNRGGLDPYWSFDHCANGIEGLKVVKRLMNAAGFARVTQSGLYFAVLDNADNLDAKAQNALRCAMDSVPAVFILTTNHLQAIDLGVKDRSHLIEMTAAPAVKWLGVFKALIELRGGVALSDELLMKVIDGCNGSAREIINAAEDIAAATREGGIVA